MRNAEKKTFTRSEAFLQLKDRRDVTTGEHLDDPLRMLADYGYTRPADPYGYSRPGPRPELFVVNPLWVRNHVHGPYSSADVFLNTVEY